MTVRRDVIVRLGGTSPEDAEAVAIAVLLVLLKRRQSVMPITPGGGRRAGWRRREREPGFRAAHSWRAR